MQNLENMKLTSSPPQKKSTISCLNSSSCPQNQTLSPTRSTPPPKRSTVDASPKNLSAAANWPTKESFLIYLPAQDQPQAQYSSHHPEARQISNREVGAGGVKLRRRALAAVVEPRLRQPRRPRGKVLELCRGRRRGRGVELVQMYNGMVVVMMMWYVCVAAG